MYRYLLLAAFLIAGYSFAAETEQVLFEAAFETSANDWRVERNGKATLTDKILRLQAFAGQPFITKLVNQYGNTFHLFVEMRTFTTSEVVLYWTSQSSPRRDETHKAVQRLTEDGDWHTYEFIFSVDDYLQIMALQFSKNDGSWDIRSMKLVRRGPPPMSVGKIVPFQYTPPKNTDGGEARNMMRFTVRNNIAVPIKYTVNAQPEELTLGKDASVDLAVPIKTIGNLSSSVLTLHPQGFPDIIRSVFLYYPEGQTDWIRREFGNEKIIEVDPKARMARILYQNKVVAMIAPLVHCNGTIPDFHLAEDSNEKTLHFTSPSAELRLGVADSELLTTKITQPADGNLQFEALCVRLPGQLRSGLLPGVEFLGGNGVSSSLVDIAPPFHDRSVPERDWLTDTFGIIETKEAAVILRWNDNRLQPTYSVPNTFDQTGDSRMSLCGTNIDATLELLPPGNSNGSTAMRQMFQAEIASHGFAEPPPALRTSSEQFHLSLQALAGLLQTDIGGEWSYAIDKKWQKKPFADFLSTLIRLNELGEFQDLTFPGISNPKMLVPGGSDITNDTIYFITNRAFDWQKERESVVRELLTTQNPDGSFLYRTRFPEFETAVSSFGFTALQTLKIMEYVRFTGNEEYYAAVKKALSFLQRCDIPCGGYYRDTPFHTPDLQTAAALIWLYVWVYEYGGDESYLQRAKQFAYYGLPFVYQWRNVSGRASARADSTSNGKNVSNRENVSDRALARADSTSYLTVAKFGGTNRSIPLAFGIADTRVGIQYAYSLTMLAKHDTAVNWKQPARGILHRIEHIQWTDGEAAGCIPEKYDVAAAKPFGSQVNPCALISLRLALEDKPESLYLFIDGKDRYVSPYPLRKKGSKGIEPYHVPTNRKFQVLLNGVRIGHGQDSGLIEVD
jgi:hypothetical protein